MLVEFFLFIFFQPNTLCKTKFLLKLHTKGHWKQESDQAITEEKRQFSGIILNVG